LNRNVPTKIIDSQEEASGRSREMKSMFEMEILSQLENMKEDGCLKILLSGANVIKLFTSVIYEFS
jgi:hypothetical protein